MLLESLFLYSACHFFYFFVFLRFVLVSEWNDGLGLCFTVECKECRVLWSTANHYYKVVQKDMCVWLEI